MHKQGLVSVLRQLHSDLDAAYGWEDLILERLVALQVR